MGSSTANSTGSAAIMMEQASSPQFNGTFGFGPVGVPPTLAGSQRYNYASSLHSTIQQQNNNYQNGESFDSKNFIFKSMTTLTRFKPIGIDLNCFFLFNIVLTP